MFTLEETAVEKGKVEMAKRSVEANLITLKDKLADVGPTEEEADELLAYVTELHSEIQHVKTDQERRWLIDKLDVRAILEADQGGERWVSFTGKLSLEGRARIDKIVSTEQVTPGRPARRLARCTRTMRRG